jgi:hypothetical protein
MSKELKDYTFEELVTTITQDAHSSLLESGGKGLRSAISCGLGTALQWSKEKQGASDTSAQKKLDRINELARIAAMVSGANYNEFVQDLFEEIARA